MAISRSVTVASSAAGKAKRFDTSASTWGELQGEITRVGIPLNNVEAIMSPGNVTLSRPEAELYAGGAFKIFLVPTKNKAGITQGEANAMAREITDAILKGAEKSSADRMKDLKSEIIEQIEEFYDVDLGDNDVEDVSLEEYEGPYGSNDSRGYRSASTQAEDDALREASRYTSR